MVYLQQMQRSMQQHIVPSLAEAAARLFDGRVFGTGYELSQLLATGPDALQEHLRRLDEEVLPKVRIQIKKGKKT